MACVIHWFRRDLRLEDNRALDHALLSGDPVVPLFVFDDYILGRRRVGGHRLRFFATALQDLDGELRARGSRLVLRHGDAAREVNHLAEETGAWAVYFNRDHTPYARQRDTRATRGLQLTGVVTQAFDDLLLVPPYATLGEEALAPPDFDAFSARWFAAFDLDPDAPASSAEGNFMAAAELPPAQGDWRADLGLDQLPVSTWPGATPASARERLRRFAGDGLAGYHREREISDEDASSRLSAALKLGTISVREVARAVLKRGAADPRVRPDAEAFVRRLAWRDYATHLLHGDPTRLGQGAAAAGPEAEARLSAWRQGMTGLPLVDAGMRQLRAEGWMPHPVRAAAAAALAGPMGCDPRAGARHFVENLVDVDLAANDLGWRLAAGEAAGLHVAAIDPDGAYVRRWVPELARVSPEHVHRPWTMSPEEQAAARCRVGIDYPDPIVQEVRDVQPG